DTLFSDANFIYTSVPEGLSGTHKVVVQPLSSYVEKSLVKPVVLTLGKTGIVDAQTEETTYE
ncbi:hypothetical protein Q4595_27500, partial [Wenyingzhuangia sp. 1_MG-2023]|nr:hypothetical protein [Wenyingzhuangia sp. 1_MG-2023]